MMWGYGMTYNWGGMLLMILSMLMWFALLGALVWGLVRWLTRSGAGYATPGSPSALEILRQRYARGEIDESVFERMRQQLLEGNSDSGGTPPRSQPVRSSIPSQ
jgi:putative membrane protein